MGKYATVKLMETRKIDDTIELTYRIKQIDGEITQKTYYPDMIYITAMEIRDTAERVLSLLRLEDAERMIDTLETNIQRLNDAIQHLNYDVMLLFCVNHNYVFFDKLENSD